MPRIFPIVNDILLNAVVEGGDEGAPLVFINSLGSDLRSWDAVIALRAGNSALSGCPLIRYDKRGHGLSDCPPAPYSIADHSTDLAGLIDYLGYERAILVGISVGGMIVMHYAAHNAGRVEALILCDTAPRIGTSAGWNERIETLRRYGMEYLSDAILERWFAPRFAKEQPAAYRFYLNMLTRMPVEGYTGTCEAIRDADLSDIVERLDAPALVLCGSEDMATPPADCKALAESIPGARFEVIDDAAHLPIIEQPHRFVDALDGFLENL